MRNKFQFLFGAGLLSVTALICNTANADSITINTEGSTWTNIVGGTNDHLNVTNGSFNDVRWGTDIGNGQSGLGFAPVAVPDTVTTGTAFLLGTLKHYNEPIGGGSAASSVELDILTSILGDGSEAFKFGFGIDETTNSTPCPFPSHNGVPCSDKITFSNLDTTASFTLNGNSYTIELLGFSQDGGNTITSDFISDEQSINTASLYAEITAPTTAVPEPASLALLGTALVGFGAIRRRRRKTA